MTDLAHAYDEHFAGRCALDCVYEHEPCGHGREFRWHAPRIGERVGMHVLAERVGAMWAACDEPPEAEQTRPVV